ncbi:MAG: tRNA dihydrouridine synthase DusB [Clostridia bacterium]|nr:tRNA dihydrouridine synthase DusB [Clostridia bacterium]
MKTQLPIVMGLAPMAGMTDWPMRVLCYRMGANYACSEMVSAMGLMCAKPGNMVYRHLLEVHPEETNTACQLFGREPSVMAEATQRVTALNRFQSIDINMGCPARKVVHSGEGSALLLKPDLAYRIMEAVKNSTHLPVTVKTRLGYDEDSMNAVELGKAAQSLGLRWLCIHGRTRQQQYSGKADYAAIARVREQLTIPVIANGDIFAGEDAARILQETGCESLMIGRGAMGNPWLFRDAAAAIAGEAAEPVSLQERVETALLHARWMVDYKGERLGVMEMRKHIGHYIGGLRGASTLRRELNMAKTLEELNNLLLRLLDGIG